MDREQHLLTIMAEECSEVAQRASKAIRFGLEEIQPDQPLSNRQRLEQELGDLLGVCDMLGIVPDAVARDRKPLRVQRFSELSVSRGRLRE